MLLHIPILIFPLRSDIIAARPLHSACVTPVLARAEDNIYTQPSVPRTRTQVRHIGHELTTECAEQGLGQRSLTLLEITNMRRERRPEQWAEAGGVALLAGPEEAPERIVKKGLMWVQQDKLFSRWKETMISVRDEMTLV